MNECARWLPFHFHIKLEIIPIVLCGAYMYNIQIYIYQCTLTERPTTSLSSTTISLIVWYMVCVPRPWWRPSLIIPTYTHIYIHIYLSRVESSGIWSYVCVCVGSLYSSHTQLDRESKENLQILNKLTANSTGDAERVRANAKLPPMLRMTEREWRRNGWWGG